MAGRQTGIYNDRTPTNDYTASFQDISCHDLDPEKLVAMLTEERERDEIECLFWNVDTDLPTDVTDMGEPGKTRRLVDSAFMKWKDIHNELDLPIPTEDTIANGMFQSIKPLLVATYMNKPIMDIIRQTKFERTYDRQAYAESEYTFDIGFRLETLHSKVSSTGNGEIPIVHLFDTPKCEVIRPNFNFVPTILLTNKYQFPIHCKTNLIKTFEEIEELSTKGYSFKMDDGNIHTVKVKLCAIVANPNNMHYLTETSTSAFTNFPCPLCKVEKIDDCMIKFSDSKVATKVTTEELLNPIPNASFDAWSVGNGPLTVLKSVDLVNTIIFNPDFVLFVVGSNVLKEVWKAAEKFDYSVWKQIDTNLNYMIDDMSCTSTYMSMIEPNMKSVSSIANEKLISAIFPLAFKSYHDKPISNELKIVIDLLCEFNSFRQILVASTYPQYTVEFLDIARLLRDSYDSFMKKVENLSMRPEFRFLKKMFVYKLHPMYHLVHNFAKHGPYNNRLYSFKTNQSHVNLVKNDVISNYQDQHNLIKRLAVFSYKNAKETFEHRLRNLYSFEWGVSDSDRVRGTPEMKERYKVLTSNFLPDSQIQVFKVKAFCKLDSIISVSRLHKILKDKWEYIRINKIYVVRNKPNPNDDYPEYKTAIYLRYNKAKIHQSWAVYSPGLHYSENTQVIGYSREEYGHWCQNETDIIQVSMLSLNENLLVDTHPTYGHTYRLKRE